MRAVLAAACVAAATVAAPASAAAPLPSCATVLANALSGDSSSCATEGLPTLGNSSVGAYRTIYVVVATGSVRADLTCDTPGLSRSVTVTSTASWGGWGGGSCTLRLTALSNGTSAVATSIGSYVIYLP